MKQYRVYLCGPSDCPYDPEFIHESYPFGCIPKDMSLTTGISKTHKQTPTEVPGLPWKIHLFDGGCDKEGITAQNRLDEYAHSKARGHTPIVLQIEAELRRECPTCHRQVLVVGSFVLRRHRSYPSGPICVGSGQSLVVT